MVDSVKKMIELWREDPQSTYTKWFLWEERIKNFRSIRSGLKTVIEEIESGRFGCQYRGSSLETVVSSVAEQRPIFKGADHAFLWKPKLRIPDIYENQPNQLAFARFLRECMESSNAENLVSSILELSAKGIKGLGPASANLLYFLHPTLLPPFNTAIVNGYNALTGAKVKLGRWDEYLAMREGILRLNGEYRNLFSNDLGAIAGLLFDVGNEYCKVPGWNQKSDEEWEEDLRRVREAVKLNQDLELGKSKKGEQSHTEIQGWLRDLGFALGYSVWIASNDQSRKFGDGKLGDRCLCEMPKSLLGNSVTETIGFIDVLWFQVNSDEIVAAFEVEHTTSIYSGILRLSDLALSPAGSKLKALYLVAPDDREEDVRTQLLRPAFKGIAKLNVGYLPYSSLSLHREAMGRFGEGLKAIEAIARKL